MLLAYMSLYRKFRPIKFSEVVGQGHIEKTLKNQIKTNRIGHAYLFTGGRGSGKTSTAKILARAVNCPNVKDGEPCNECDLCKSAIAGSLVDITEMDAASNNGVDNIRDIREEVEFIPTSAKYRVYIIDEVHMLSTGAFNALLKTLEEPPQHVIFILATTEPQKLPTTIISRCQRFDFKKISVLDIMNRLQYICDECDIKIEENAKRLIASLSDGAMRDAISILERCISEGDEIISEQKVRELSGVPKFEMLIAMTEALINKNSSQVLTICKTLIDEGKDVSVYLWELIKLQRDIAIDFIGASLEGYSEDQKSKIKELAGSSNQQFFLDLIAKLSDIQTSIKWSTEQEVLFEAKMIKLCLQNDSQNIVKDNYSKPSTTNNILLNTDNSIEDINTNLSSKVLTILKENGKMRLQADLLTTRIELQNDGIVHIIFDGNILPMTKANFQKEESKIAIKSAVHKALGKEVSVKYDNFK